MLGNEEVASWLLDHGARLDFPQSEVRDDLKKGEKDGTLALLNQAAAQGNMAMFDRLVSLGANPSHSLALHYAAASAAAADDKRPPGSNAADAVIGHLIQQHGFDVDAEDSCGGLVQLSDFTVSGQEGPPLVRAVCHGNLPAVRALLRHGADAGQKAVRTAVERDNRAALEALLEAGGDATYACCIAASRAKLDAARVCLRHGADPRAAVRYDAELASKSGTHAPMSRAMADLLLDPKYC